VEHAAGAEAGAIAQAGDRFGAKPFRKPAARCGVGKVERLDFDPDRELRAQVVGQLVIRSLRRATSSSG
jgi:hypothetical protein